MGSIGRLVFWGCILPIGTLIMAQSTTTFDSLTHKSYTCNNPIYAFFSSDKLTSQLGGKNLPNDTIQYRFFVRILVKIVAIARETGINCTLEKATQKLKCCKLGSLEKFQAAKENWLQNRWGHEISTLNVVAFFVNMFILMLMMGFGVITTIRCPDTLVPVGLRESYGLNRSWVC